jgi:hypothetical protein
VLPASPPDLVFIEGLLTDQILGSAHEVPVCEEIFAMSRTYWRFPDKPENLSPARPEHSGSDGNCLWTAYDQSMKWKHLNKITIVLIITVAAAAGSALGSIESMRRYLTT